MAITLTENNAQNTISKADKPIVIEAFATWCSHCTAMRPLFLKLEKELGDTYIFAAFDIDDSPELATTFNVTSLPTFIFLKDGQEAGRIVGEMSQEELKRNIEHYLG